jgi:D-alanyl-D-alanine carboxypeptidase/D-alanyl-D-alanine-endopeptidase (penicillin-binding protein 4)
VRAEAASRPKTREIDCERRREDRTAGSAADLQRLCLLVLWLLLPAGTRAASLAERINRILSEPAARRAFWGIKAVDLDSGRTLYQHNADRLFTPASNTKLFSTALALTRLGPGYRFTTRLAASSPPDAQGRIHGDLILVGGGDPNFSARVLPFQKHSEFSGDRLAPIDGMAAEAAAAGIVEVDGDVVGDDTFYLWEPYPQGWALEDTINGDGAPVTGLVINDNTVTLSIRPGQNAGDPAVVHLEPPERIFPYRQSHRDGPSRSAGQPDPRLSRA